MRTALLSLARCFDKVFWQKALHALLCSLLIGVSVTFTQPLRAEGTSEYALKAVFLYNFAVFTSWPDRNMYQFNLCIYGKDPFCRDLDALMKSKRIYDLAINIHRVSDMAQLDSCQLVFISRSVISNLSDVIHVLKDKPVLTVADSPGASQQGVMLNMNVQQDKVTFEANFTMAKKNGLHLSSQLLRLTKEVY